MFIADFENKLRMMGFDVNSQGNSATVDLPPSSCRTPSLPPKPSAVSTPSTNASKKPAAVASSVSSTPVSSGSGGYSLYSLIKKQSQSTPAVQRPALSNTKLSTSSPAKSTASSQPASVLKKPSAVASLTAEKPSANSVTVTSSHNAVSFASPVVKSAAVNESDCIHPQRFVRFLADSVTCILWPIVIIIKVKNGKGSV